MRLLFLLFTAASGNILLKSKKAITDEIGVGGETLAQGDGIRNLVDQCAPLTKPFGTAKVCGCGYRIHAFLTADCKDYHQYKHTVGSCDCSVEGCAEATWETGYTEKFNWKASSYMVEKCPAGR